MANFEVEREIELLQVKARLKEIHGTLYSQRQPIGNLEICVTGPGKGPERAPKEGWKPFKTLDRWGGFDQTAWFRMRAVLPESFAGHRAVALLRAAEHSFLPDMTNMPEGGESLAYVNGVPFQGLDRNRDELILADPASGGETFEIVLEACPSTRFDIYHIFAYADIAVMNPDVWSFYWDCQVLYEVIETLPPKDAARRKLAQLLGDCIRMVDLQHIGTPRYFESIENARRMVRIGLEGFGASPHAGKLVLAGHAHIDTAWLWPLRETQRKCARTFSTVLRLMELYPEFHFSCSQPVQYEWMRDHYPEIFEGIKQRVEEGRWELCGAPWVEPDHNVPSGESLIRQYLYGNRWFEHEFGRRSTIAWVPDSFGYTWALPQIMRKSGLTAFITTKISWSMFTKFPYSMFEWEGVDGARIFALIPPLNYNGNPLPSECVKQWDLFEQKEHVDELPFAFGWGDGGGGPTMNMLERGRRLKGIEGIPSCEFGRITDCVERMREQCRETRLPVYNGELYLELHRGCQTTHARTKRLNRKCEFALRNAEWLSAMALVHGGTYDAGTLYRAWKLVLTNQFHDILPGSSITEVYTTAEAQYTEALRLAEGIQAAAISYLTGLIDTSGPGRPLVVFNPTASSRLDVAVARVPLPDGPVSVHNFVGDPVPCQVVDRNTIVFEADPMPSFGHAVFWLTERRSRPPATGLRKPTTRRLENEFVRVKLDKNGQLTSVYDKIQDREVLPQGCKGNVLQLFDDRPFLHDAWDIDHNFDAVMWEPGPAESVEVIESGPVRAVVRVVRKTEKSTITQDITLHSCSARIDFVTHVDWWEKRTLLKVAFPVDIRSSHAVFDIQFGAVERATHNNTEFDRARFEAPAHKWAALTEAGYGVALLNDCKYGYDVKGNVLRLSLLRSPVDPDPKADEGEHHFTYALLPFSSDEWEEAITEGYQLNNPLIVAEAEAHSGILPVIDTFAITEPNSVVIETVKRHEDSGAIIVRLYEALGGRGWVTAAFGRKLRRAAECDLMEENDQPVSLSGSNDQVELYFTPYEIKTLKLWFEPIAHP